MLYKDENGNFALMAFVATYVQHGELFEQHIVNKEELEAFQELGHIQDLEFTDVTYDAGVVERLAEVSEYPDEQYQVIEAYVLRGEVSPGSALQTSKQQETLEQSILDLTLLVLGGGL